MFTSLRTRLWVTYVLLTWGSLLIVGVGLLLYLIRTPTQQIFQQIQQAANSIEGQSALIQAMLPPRLLAAAQRADKALGMRVVILDQNGSVLADSREPTATPLPHIDSPSKDEIVAPNLRYTDNKGQVWLYTVRPLGASRILVVAYPMSRLPLRQLLRNDITLIFLAALLALLFSLGAAYLMARWVSAPLQHISKSIHSMPAGEYRPILLDGPQEVQDLAQSFNRMSEKVLDSQKAQRDFIANVSHDLKTPLTSIQGFAQAILDGTASTPDALHQAAGVIYSEANRMHRMVIDLLELTRLDSGIANLNHAPVDMNQLLQGTMQKLEPQARQAQIALHQDIQPLPVVIGDADRLAQVFTNLLENAIKYTPAGGQVWLYGKSADGVVEVDVSDTGQGISSEDLPHVFERFYQTDKSRRGGSQRGVGLGLAIAREIILAHQGTISVQSIPGHGSTFMVKIPVVRPDDSTFARRNRK